MYRWWQFRITWLRGFLFFLFGFSIIMLFTMYSVYLVPDNSLPKCTVDLPKSKPIPVWSFEITNCDINGSLMTDSPIESSTDSSISISDLQPFPVIYVITPTYPRMEQIAELTNFGQILMMVENIHWLVIEDADVKTPEVEHLLDRLNIPHTYLMSRMPKKYQISKKGGKPKGVANRLVGVEWVKKYGNDDGVMYFADDDNTYDVRLFEEMRWTKKVSMWPVGLVTNLGVSTPIVKNGHVVGFYDGWIAKRKFPVDMAGFAVNVAFLKTVKDVTMPFKAGYQEDGFLKSLKISIHDIEPKACDCTVILVWHTKTFKNKPAAKISSKDRKKWKGTNIFAFPFIV